MDHLKERIRSSLWAIPAAFVMLSIVLALALVALDRDLDQTRKVTFVFEGSAEAARSLLAVIAGSVVSLTGLVFSIMVVVFQLTSSQFSPRALRTFLQDRASKITLASFLATFAFSLMVMRAVREADGPVGEFIPRISITTAVAASLLSMGVFVYYIHHISLSIRVSSLIERIHAETAALVERSWPSIDESQEAPGVLPGEEGSLSGSTRVVTSEEAGYVVHLNIERLLSTLRSGDAVARFVPQVGEFVSHGQPLFEVWGGEEERLPAKAFRRCVILAAERTMEQDVLFGLRQLADIAVRALSPGINDPTTARNALNHIGDLLLLLAGRRTPPETLRDEEGRLRLLVTQPQWNEILSDSLQEIAHYGRDSPLVSRDLSALLGRLRSVLPAEALLGLESLREAGDLPGLRIAGPLAGQS